MAGVWGKITELGEWEDWGVGIPFENTVLFGLPVSCIGFTASGTVWSPKLWCTLLEVPPFSQLPSLVLNHGTQSWYWVGSWLLISGEQIYLLQILPSWKENWLLHIKILSLQLCEKSWSFLEFAWSYVIFTIGPYESDSQWAQRQPFLCGSQVLKQWRTYPFPQWLHPPELLTVKPGTSFSSVGGQPFSLALLSSTVTVR